MNEFKNIKTKLLVVGNGMASDHFVEAIVTAASDRFKIDIFGEESCGSYNRILISDVLAGKKNKNDILFRKKDWYQQHDITCHLGERVDSIDKVERTITTNRNEVFDYDILVLALGSKPNQLSVPGSHYKPIIYYRDMSDVEKINALIAEGKKGVILGGGLLGLEAAFSLSQIKHNVPVVHIYNTLMEKQLDEESSTLLKSHLQKQGISFYTPTTIKQVLGSESSNEIKSVELQSGEVIPADYIIMTAGVKPHTERVRLIKHV